MRLFEMKSEHFELSDVAKIASTLDFHRKFAEAQKITEDFIAMCKKPAVSFGGGKDSMAVLIIAQTIDPDIMILCADPPNPLTGREEHLRNVSQVCHSDIIHVSYDWDVRAVLNGELKYPDGLKKTILWQAQLEHEIDGIIWGCRISESWGRRMNFAKNGYIYDNGRTKICQPIAKWSAYEVLALACVTGYPINPVYEKMDGYYDLDRIHDGTWWPHETSGVKGDWIKRYYPEHYENYKTAEALKSKWNDAIW